MSKEATKRKITPEQAIMISLASQELEIPADCLRLMDSGLVLVNFPMVSFGEPAKELKKENIEAVKHFIEDLKRDIFHIVNPATPFKEKRNRGFVLDHHILSSFLNMVSLKHYFPNIEFLMPNGIERIQPGLFYSTETRLQSRLLFKVNKFIPPSQSELLDQVGITFSLKPPHGKNIYTHSVTYQRR